MFLLCRKHYPNPRAYERDFAKHPNLQRVPENLNDLEIHSVSTGKREQEVYL